jgi:hypothetical protein
MWAVWWEANSSAKKSNEACGKYRRGPASKNIAALVGAGAWARLPAHVRARFDAGLRNADYSGEGVFEATAVGRAFARAGVVFGRPLPCHVGRASVDICVEAAGDGETWTRRYRFAHALEMVSSLKRAGDGPWLEERAGPLVMRLNVFVERHALVFECIDFRLRIGRFEILLPIVFTPGRIRVEHHDLGGGRFLFTLEARHPWFGRTFHQRCEMRDVSIRGLRPTEVAGERDASNHFRKSMHHLDTQSFRTREARSGIQGPRDAAFASGFRVRPFGPPRND